MSDDICTQVPWGEEFPPEVSDDESDSSSSGSDSDDSNSSQSQSESDNESTDSEDASSSTDSDEDGDDDSIILSDDEEGGDMAAVSISDADSDGEPLHMAVKKSNRWKPGQELRIRFIGGHSSIRDKVKKYARVWERYAYIKFKFSQNEPSQIRISFRRNGGSWSKVGKDALNTDSTKPTMNLKISAATSEARIRRTVLHEFGHALGCVHEHSSPSATGKIKWNRQAVYDDHQGIWTREQVDHNIFKTYKGTITQFSRFDQKSIMLYPIPSSWTMDGWHSNLNTTLSDTDKSFIAKLYPKPKRRRHSRRGSQGRSRRPHPTPITPSYPRPGPSYPHRPMNGNGCGNLCGNPCCGVTFICNADYNRRVRALGYPGV